MRNATRIGLLALALMGVYRLAEAQAMTEFPIPDPNTYPVGLTAGLDGNVWFTQITRVFGPCGFGPPPSHPQVCASTTASAISRITPTGVITEFPIARSADNVQNQPVGITSDHFGNLWFTELPGAQIGRLTLGGVFNHFSASPGIGYGDGGEDIVPGPDGNLWFTSPEGSIGQVTPAGVISEFPEPSADCGNENSNTGCGFDGITSGPDGNLWFTEYWSNHIGRITPAGAMVEIAIPTANSFPRGIAAGPDGNLWFAEAGANKIGRITTAGVVTEFTVPTARADPWSLAAGPDGNLWFTEANQIGRITPSGVFAEFTVPTSGSGPDRIVSGPDGNIWFTEANARQIGRLTLPLVVTCGADVRTLCLSGNRFSVTADFQSTPEGPSAPATAVRLTPDTGYFWFFDPANIEVVAKVLDGCSTNGHYWFFASGLTNVGVQINVTDTLTGASKPYSNPVGTAFPPIQDTAAFPCP
jgi:streptogramin lyase